MNKHLLIPNIISVGTMNHVTYSGNYVTHQLRNWPIFVNSINEMKRVQHRHSLASLNSNFTRSISQLKNKYR